MIINNIIRFICLVLLIGYCILTVRGDGQTVVTEDNFSTISNGDFEFYGCDTKNYDHSYNEYYISAYNEITADNGVFIGTPNINYSSNNVVDNEYPRSNTYDGKTIFMP